MFFFLILSTLSIDTVDSIRRQLQRKQFDAAYASSNKLILQQGTLDADSILFFLRGFACVKTDRFEQGIIDLSRFLRTEPNSSKDGIEAITLRGTAYLKTGNLEEAKKESEKSKSEPLIKSIRKAELLLNTATSNETSPKVAIGKYLELLKICSSSEVFLRDAANIALNLGNNTLFNTLSQKALKISPKDPKLLEMRGKYHFSNAELIMAQKFAKACINSAADSSKCTAMLKAINSFQSNEKDAISLVNKKKYDLAQKNIEICQQIVDKYSTSDSPLSNRIKGIQVKVLISKNQKEKAVTLLNDLIKESPKSVDLLLQRGELLISLGDYTGALSDLQVVKDKTKSNSAENKKAIKLIEKASELQEKERNVDYYTILGLKRGASMQDVKSAYRKLVVKWHPDRFKEPFKKKEAEKKMKMINRAYDVLSDEQKKKMYDLGQDPDNQMPSGPPPGSDNQRFYNFNNGGSSGGGRGSRQYTFSYGTNGGGGGEEFFKSFASGFQGNPFEDFNIGDIFAKMHAQNFKKSSSSSSNRGKKRNRRTK